MPQAWYCVRFRTRTDGAALWAAVMFNHCGAELPDHYDGIEVTPEWTEIEGYFRAKDQAHTARMRFHPLDGGQLELSDVTVSRRQSASVGIL